MTRITIVGPCAAGKSTLAKNLQARGYAAEDCAQEHSGVQAMWQRITHPDLLVYLDANIETINRRRGVNWEAAYLAVMNQRLAHARAHAHLYLDTNALTPEQVCDRAITFLEATGILPTP